MAKSVEVTETFSIGKNEYKKGKVLSFSDELASKYSSKLKPAKKQVDFKKQD